MSSTENVKVNLLLHHWDQLEHSELAWLNQTERCSQYCYRRTALSLLINQAISELLCLIICMVRYIRAMSFGNEKKKTLPDSKHVYWKHLTIHSIFFVSMILFTCVRHMCLRKTGIHGWIFWLASKIAQWYNLSRPSNKACYNLFFVRLKNSMSWCNKMELKHVFLSRFLTVSF